jgi:hypothetical protein
MMRESMAEESDGGVNNKRAAAEAAALSLFRIG